MAALKEGAAKGETANNTITATSSIEEFREQRRQEQKPTDDADKRAKKPTISTTGVSNPQLRLNGKIRTRNFFAPRGQLKWKLTMEETSSGQHQKAPSRQVGRAPPAFLASRVYPINLQRQLQGSLKGNFEFHSTGSRKRVVTKKRRIFQLSALTPTAITSIPNPQTCKPCDTAPSSLSS
jgi:hypothetical protein